MGKQYKHILFDWDNCLANTDGFWVQAFEQALEKRGKVVTDEKERTMLIESLFRENLHPVTPGESTTELWQDIYTVVTELNKNVELNDHALEVLEQCRSRNLNVALVSTSRRAALESGLHAQNLGEFFDIIIANDDVKNIKPHPEALEKALAFFEGKPEDAVMIGDKDSDIYAAHSAGTDSILYFPEEHRDIWDYDEFMKSKPTHVIKELKELLDILR